MIKVYNTAGTMSGTSFDGIDVSLAKTNGIDIFENKLNLYEAFDNYLKLDLKKIKNSIKNKNDVFEIKQQPYFIDIENKITDLHIKLLNELQLKSSNKIDLIGFHGITLFHDAKEKFTFQAGNAQRVFEKTKIPVVYNFRDKDLVNGGQGAPLTPVFHKYILDNLKLRDMNFDGIVNIGGISNISYLKNKKLYASDIGPGNCLLDDWCNEFFKQPYDKEGLISQKSQPDLISANNFIDRFIFNKNLSFDYNDFSISEFRSLEDSIGLATLAFITSNLILSFLNEKNIKNILVSGGGRKNNTILGYLKGRAINIDKVNIDGDFVESQSFSYIATRSVNDLEITFPETTGVKIASKGGEFLY